MKEIKQISDDIEKYQKELLEDEFGLENFKEELYLYEDRILQKVEEEVDDNGKKVFSNDTMRKRELKKRLSDDGGYQKISKEYKERKKDIALTKV